MLYLSHFLAAAISAAPPAIVDVVIIIIIIIIIIKTEVITHTHTQTHRSNKYTVLADVLSLFMVYKYCQIFIRHTDRVDIFYVFPQEQG